MEIVRSNHHLRHNHPSCRNYNRYESYSDRLADLMPSSAGSLRRRMARAERNQRITVPETNVHGLLSKLLLGEVLKVTASHESVYEDIYKYFRKESGNLNEAFVEENLETPDVVADDLNETFVLETIPLYPSETPEPPQLKKSKSFKKSITSALIAGSKLPRRIPQKMGGGLKNIVNFFENKRTDDDENDGLDIVPTDWQFFDIPEAEPEHPIIIPANAMSPYTPAYFCRVNVRSGKVRPIIDHFNRMNEIANETDDHQSDADGPEVPLIEKNTNAEPSTSGKSTPSNEAPMKKPGVETFMDIGSFEESRKNLLKFMEAASRINYDEDLEEEDVEEWEDGEDGACGDDGARGDDGAYGQDGEDEEDNGEEEVKENEEEKPTKPISRMGSMRKSCLLRIRSIVRSLKK